MLPTKQVIVVRTDLKMPVGKIAAQVSHATMAFLTKGNKLYGCDLNSSKGLPLKRLIQYFEGEFAEEVDAWIQNDFTKVCVKIDTEEELLAIHDTATKNGLVSHLVTDNGRTCFNNVPTNTCLCLGPHYIDKFWMTKHLKLL